MKEFEKKNKYKKKKVKQIRERTEVDVFFKDLIKIPEVSGLLKASINADKTKIAFINGDEIAIIK